ncbi:MAG: 1-acyl-sn-glycerol-3-phosphate acyltransferase, partial [Nodosilinea sp.]
MKSSASSESSAAVSKGGAVAPVRSRCSPVLTPLAYLLGQHLVVPLYFGAITIIGQHRVPAAGPIILAPPHRARWDSILL